MRTIYTNHLKSLAALTVAAMTVLLTGCGASGLASTTPTGPTAATLTLSAAPATVPSDNTGTATVTVTALSSTNAAVSGVVVTLGTDTGVVGAQTVTTGTDGSATFTFRSGVTSLANRTATITATAGAATAQLPIQISGSTLSVFSTTATTVPDDGTSPVTVTFVAKNAQGTALVGTPYTVAWATTGGGQLTITPTSGVTDSNGQFSVSVAGVAGAIGTARVTATSAGSTASVDITVSLSTGTFAITSVKNNTSGLITQSPSAVAMFTSDTLLVSVGAPAPATSVTFITSSGTWNGVANQTSLTVPVGTGCPANAAGLVCATLTAPPAGTTSVQVLSVPNSLSDSLAVSVTAKVPYAITLQASPSLVAKSVGSTTGVSTLVATVVDSTGAPVGNAPVAFSLLNTTGGGESVSPVLAHTATIAGGGLALGQAQASFTSGSLSSDSNGVQVRAKVLGTAVETEANLPNPVNLTPSGSDAAIVIGGTATSIAFGIATKVVVPNTTTYQLPMSVLVADVHGNPAANTSVTLSAWPVAWSTGTVSACLPDGDNGVDRGTFASEDANSNVILDPLEDGHREFYATGVAVAGGAQDGVLTPINSAAGTLPGSVITDANGVANFDLTYLKTSAIWTVVRIRASAVVQGSEAVNQIIFRLIPAETDTNPCVLDSPYFF